MEWVAESISAITDFKFQFKKQTDDYYYRANMIVQDGDSEKDWAEVDNIPPKSNGDNFYSGKHTLKGLEPATRYLARVSSKNDYGFNKFSQPFHFATKGAGKNKIYLYCHNIVFLDSHLSLGIFVTLFMIYEPYTLYKYIITPVRELCNLLLGSMEYKRLFE